MLDARSIVPTHCPRNHELDAHRTNAAPPTRRCALQTANLTAGQVRL